MNRLEGWVMHEDGKVRWHIPCPDYKNPNKANDLWNAEYAFNLDGIIGIHKVRLSSEIVPLDRTFGKTFN